MSESLKFMEKVENKEDVGSILYHNSCSYLDKNVVIDFGKKQIGILKLDLEEFGDRGQVKETVNFYLRRKKGKKRIVNFLLHYFE